MIQADGTCNPPPPPTIITNKKPSAAALRYVEARRNGTCAFADRIATLSINHYKEHVNETIRSTILPQTCIATIVAAFHVTNFSSKSSLQEELQNQEIYTPSIVDLKVIAMGVGTKFLSEQTIQLERDQNDDATTDSLSKTTTPALLPPYGTRIRDCHAEVLCRRAFRKYLFDCIEQQQQVELELQSNCTTSSYSDSNHHNNNNNSILERCVPPQTNSSSLLSSLFESTDDTIMDPSPLLCYQLRTDVTLHMYCSSTPCGNSTIKKFATLQKEIYCTTLSNDTWPSNCNNHLNTPIIGHSIPLGQFAVLVKKDSSCSIPTTSVTASTTKMITTTDDIINHVRVLSKKEASWPIYTTMDWCPPGTATVWSNQGSIHTCSDKIARWNYLGYQGSLLSTFLKAPIYITTITVGRKFSSMTCRRAICCRLDAHNNMKRSIHHTSKKRVQVENQRENTKESTNTTKECIDSQLGYQLHHPTVMGTSVYMDETGFIDMSVISQTESKFKNTTTDSKEVNDDSIERVVSTSFTNSLNSSGEVRFLSPMSFVTWLQQHPSSNRIMKDTDYEMECINGSTGFLMDDTTTDNDCSDQRLSKVCSFELMNQYLCIDARRLGNTNTEQRTKQAQTLGEYRKLKQVVAWQYEQTKDSLLGKHPVLRDWKRRIDQ